MRLSIGYRPARWRLAAWLPGVLALVVGLGGCASQYAEFQSQLEKDFGGEGELLSRFIGGDDETRSEPAQVEDVRSLSAILADLQVGKYAEGEAALRRYIEEHPDDDAARAILRQLTEDPEAMLGRRSYPYTVKPGDSWSGLAARTLGDPGLFLVLARYNDSTNPSDLRVGEAIRLPGPPPAEPEEEKTDDGVGEPALASIPEAPLPSRRTVDALTLPDQPLSSVDTTPRPGESDHERAERLQQEGLDLLAASDEEAALARFRAALALEPGIQPAASRAPELRDRLVSRYHERAILRYRNQDLDGAIALWDRVIAIDPDFEPARSYRARARELKRRLDSL
jgi:hypothetical protein